MWLLVIIILMLTTYLFYALLNPEKF
ncbi:MAG: K(+)-transporting ATPase subunit F [[Clostridium] spiroforme]|uniref:K(+)-transporting ATPase subunit F n=1 Tax=Thomasclavelia spiroformis TaxID=29348 RepID=A0A943EHY8_9FIRM|nr:K(+)-transporting ATPase subunit F [Thomasclavelia spiroformis]